jgi:4-aminobutyrate aminotransferase/(S)-3-amino-2-methylpropionate transaminase
MASLSTTRSKPIHKVGIPSFAWPAATFPDIKHPYYLNETYNAEQENLALQSLEKQLQNLSVAAVILEPVLAEGGDKLASPNFYIGVQNLCKKYGAIFIVDEVQTGGGATGRFWAHEHWGPRFDADIVTFAKKLQVSGFFYKSHLQLSNSEDTSNPFNTDILRLLNFQSIHRIMKIDRLMRNSEQAGHALRAGLQDLSDKQLISNVRGLGSFLAYDLPTPALANTLVSEMLKYGVNIGTCGSQSIRVRPSLVFQQKHAEVYLERLEIALKGLYN